jgi:hypothetical protein
MKAFGHTCGVEEFLKETGLKFARIQAEVNGGLGHSLSTGERLTAEKIRARILSESGTDG